MRLYSDTSAIRQLLFRIDRLTEALIENAPLYACRNEGRRLVLLLLEWQLRERKYRFENLETELKPQTAALEASLERIHQAFGNNMHRGGAIQTSGKDALLAALLTLQNGHPEHLFFEFIDARKTRSYGSTVEHEASHRIVQPDVRSLQQ